MKKLVLSTVFAATVASALGVTSPAAEIVNPSVENASNVYFVGQRYYKILGFSLKFNNIIGYQTAEDATAQQNGRIIGFEVEPEFMPFNNPIRFVDSELAQQDMWVCSKNGLLNKITIEQMNSKKIDLGFRPIENGIILNLGLFKNFINKFDALSEVEKNIYLDELWQNASVLLSCDNQNLFRSIKDLGSKIFEVIDFYNDFMSKTEFSTIEKLILAVTVFAMQKESNGTYEFEATDLFMPGNIKSFEFFDTCEMFTTDGGNDINYSNLIGYKSQSDADNGKNGIICGTICEVRVAGLFSAFYYIINPAFYGKGLYIKPFLSTVYDSCGLNAPFINLKDVQDYWTEFRKMDVEKREELLDGLIEQAKSKIFFANTYVGPVGNGISLLVMNVIEDMVDTLKSTKEKKFTTTHKFMLYLLKHTIEKADLA